MTSAFLVLVGHIIPDGYTRTMFRVAVCKNNDTRRASAARFLVVLGLAWVVLHISGTKTI